MAFLYYLTFLALLSTPSVWGKPEGAPIGACSILGPRHIGPDGKPHESQTTPAPYKFTLDSNSVAVGEPLKVELVATGTDDIKGFLVQAHLGNSPVGTFSADLSEGHAQVLQCDAPSDSLTHTRIRGNDVKSIKFEWTPSADLKGKTVKLIGTIAVSFVKFWVKGVTADIQVV